MIMGAFIARNSSETQIKMTKLIKKLTKFFNQVFMATKAFIA